jgi:hypothetical protein
MLAEKVMDPVFKLAEEGYHVVLFMDEIQQAEDGDISRGEVSLRDRIKQYAEKDSRVTLALATTIDELEMTIAKDPASLNRYVTVFHSAASPDKTIKILLLKPYVTDIYGVEAIDYDALKAVYLLGQKATTKPSSHTSAEMYFMEVLQEARESGVKRINLDFVFDHYDRNYASVTGGRGILKPETLEKIFDYEVREVAAENERDHARLRKVELESGGVKRINAPWYELGENFVTEETVGGALKGELEGARVAVGGDAQSFDTSNPIVKAMMERPEYRLLQSWERAEYAKAIDGIMNELRVFGELGRFYDAAEKRFLEGKFEVLAEASRKGGRVTMAELTKAAEAVERTNPKAAKDAKRTAEKFAKEAGKKK